MYIGTYVYRYVCTQDRYVHRYVCLYAAFRQHAEESSPPVVVEQTSVPLTKRLRNTVGTANTKPDVALPRNGFFTNILGKGSEVSSKDLQVPAFALIVLNVLVIIILILMITIIITTTIILPATQPATSTNQKHQ